MNGDIHGGLDITTGKELDRQFDLADETFFDNRLEVHCATNVHVLEVREVHQVEFLVVGVAEAALWQTAEHWCLTTLALVRTGWFEARAAA